MNGTLQCSNGATIGVFEDTCTFSCNAGYELQGSNNGTCLANKSWSRGNPVCEPLRCSDITIVADDISGVGTVAAVAAMAAALFASFQRPKVIFTCRRLYYNYVTFNTLR